jgi:hypothetical protein
MKIKRDKGAIEFANQIIGRRVIYVKGHTNLPVLKLSNIGLGISTLDGMINDR